MPDQQPPRDPSDTADDAPVRHVSEPVADPVDPPDATGSADDTAVDEVASGPGGGPVDGAASAQGSASGGHHGADAEADDPPAEPAGEGEAAADPERSGRGGSSFLRELPVLLLIAFLLAFLLRTFVVQVFYIPSSSMETTLRVNDRMAVEKITYLFRSPQRGEVVVFEGESLGELDPDATVPERAIRGVGQFLGVVPTSARDFVKRVIGLPGDEVYIEDGQVFVNDEPLDEPYVTYDDPSDYGPVTVPEGSLFFLGDNRPNSSDSRRSLGFVPEAAVVGRSAAVIWPLDHVGLLTGVEHHVPSAGGEATGVEHDVRSSGGPGAGVTRDAELSVTTTATDDPQPGPPIAATSGPAALLPSRGDGTASQPTP